MGRPKKKTDYDPDMQIMRKITDLVSYFGDTYDDREPTSNDHISLRDAAKHFGITILKARKMLITAGIYTTYSSRRIQELSHEGKSEKEIMKITGLSRASVNSYIPYKRIVYNLPTLSVDADRKKKQRTREQACRRFMELLPDRPREEIEDELWKLLELHAGCIFHTANGLKFRYKVRNGELFIDGQKDGITMTTVLLAWWQLIEVEGDEKGPRLLEGNATSPKQLEVDGAEYLHPIFERFGATAK